MTRPTINVILTRQAVNQGDHGQDITSAHEVRPDETVGELVDRLLTSQMYRYPPTTDRQAEVEWYLTVRLAEPAPARVATPDEELL